MTGLPPDVEARLHRAREAVLAFSARLAAVAACFEMRCRATALGRWVAASLCSVIMFFFASATADLMPARSPIELAGRVLVWWGVFIACVLSLAGLIAGLLAVLAPRHPVDAVTLQALERERRQRYWRNR